MKRVLLAVLAVVLSVGLTLPEAEAKRLGGGKSTGIQREATPSAPTAPSARPADAPMAGAAAAAPKKNSWLGPVAGLAAGLGLAALASHLGFGEGLANVMMIALLVMAAFFVFRLLMRKRAAPQAPGMQYAGMGAGGNVTLPAGVPAPAAVAATAAPAPARIPAGFDAEAFVRQAKLNFVRLQAANDEGNLADLREFVTPEMFAELQLQIAERGHVAQRTEVVDLHAEIVECVEEAQRYVASVRFHGLISEEREAPPVAFDERWHLTKPTDGSRGWAVAGIQQAA